MLQFSFLYWVIRHCHILNCHILATERTSDNTLNTGKQLLHIFKGRLSKHQTLLDPTKNCCLQNYILKWNSLYL